MPLLSVVIPTYNRVGLICQTLASVLEQQFEDLEVIVVDDGSTDATELVIREYSSRVTFVRQQNKGPGAARNRGASVAKGAYLAFLDSDDLWFRWSARVYADVIKVHNSPAVVTGAPFRFKTEKQLASVEAAPILTEQFADYFSSSDEWRWYSTSSFVIRKDCFEEVGGFHEDWGGEDAELMMRLGVAPGFVHICSPATFGYRLNNDGLVDDPTYSLAGVKVLIKLESKNRFPGGSARRRERLEIITRHARPAALHCLERGESREGWALYGATWRWNAALRRWKYLAGFPLMALWGRQHA